MGVIIASIITGLLGYAWGFFKGMNDGKRPMVDAIYETDDTDYEDFYYD